MRTLVCWGAVFVLILTVGTRSVPAAPQELENRLTECTETLKSMMGAPDASIPGDLLRRSQAIVIYPALLKAGLGFGGHYGKGVILRREPMNGKWGPPAFIRLVGGSFGWQAGVQATELVLLITSHISLKSLFRDKFTIGADASVAAGPVGRDASAGTDLALSEGILSYSRAKGLFVGVSIKGSILEPDWAANESYYGSDVSLIEIFFKGRGKVSPAALKLMATLNDYTK